MRTTLFVLGLTGLLCAQTPNPTQQNVTQPEQGQGGAPLYRVTVVGRSTKAINYRHRGGDTKVDLRGTALMPEARGKAEVESKGGYLEVKVDVENLQNPSRFGPEYLTYVAWAISPEGRATNLGEVILRNDESELKVTTELQTFGLIVTAEPYFAVMQPSDVVVMENIVRSDTRGKVEEIDARFELLQRGQYTMAASPAERQPLPIDSRMPLDLVEARNAARIARWAGADKYATETFRKAEQALVQAETYQTRKPGQKPVSTAAREAVQTFEEARVIALRRIEQERLAAERQAAADREQKAKLEAEESRKRQILADEQRKLEELRRQKAEEERATAERLTRESQLAAQRSADEAARAEKAKAEADAARLALQQESERLKLEAEARQRQLSEDAERARQAAAEADRLRNQAENEKTQLRQQLLEQFNRILETRDTARGLIVNMSDVLFDTGKHNLRPAAREKLARISGIALGHPGLRFEVEGHTDSVGSDDYNQSLSERRAMTVRDYLVQQGLSMNSVTAKGFGESQPVTSNDSAAGRQQNRRVELVVSGEVIGTSITSRQPAPTTQPVPRQ